jgi:hypothetical protein
MLISLGKAGMMLSLLALGGTLSSSPQRETSHTSQTSQRMLMIRVSQESSPGAGDFDSHILGFITAWNSNGGAADFYMYGKPGPDYGNSEPALKNNTCHVFFVNAADGLALIVVNNKSNDNQHSTNGNLDTRFDLSGGTAKVLISDDAGETKASDGGTVFISHQNWAASFTDGEVIGTLPVGFKLLGQFTSTPRRGIDGWEILSADGLVISLSMTPGQRVRLDVGPLAVQVQQDR